MRKLTPEFQQHLTNEVTTLATCWKIIRTDGVQMGFTDHDCPIVLNEIEYDSIAGFNPTTIENKSDMSVDNMEVEGISFPSKITEADLLAGIYDYAEVEVFLINYENLNQGKMILKRGLLGEVNLTKNMFKAEIRGLTQHLSLVIGDVYSPSCSAILGDNRCKIDLKSFTINSRVTFATDKQNFIAKDLAKESGYYASGEIKWLSGANKSYRMEIKEFVDDQITLVLPMPNGINSDDEFEIIAGCDKSKDCCIKKFDNIINFRGFPDVPGIDKLHETPYQ